MKRHIIIAGLLMAAFAAAADVDDPDYDFYGFRISAGYQCGINLKSSFTPVFGRSKDEAYQRATGQGGRYRSDDGGFIVKDDGGGDAAKTTYWQVPSSAVSVDGDKATISLVNRFQDYSKLESADDSVAHGAHVELSATIGRDGDWGLDVFLGFSWMIADGCFKADGDVANCFGAYRTTATASTSDLMAHNYLDWNGKPTGDTIGPGRPWEEGDGPQIGTSLGKPKLIRDNSVTSYHAEGDYQEYDLYGGLRLWYADEEYEWFKFTATIGFGADYGDFEYQMSAVNPSGGISVRDSKREHDIDFYGLLGLGFMVNIWKFDVSADALWRYGQDPIRIDSQYMHGEIERPDFIFRASLGYSF